MAEMRAREPSSTPSAVPVVEAASYGGLFGIAAAGAAAVVTWLVLRTTRRRRARGVDPATAG